MLLTVRRSTIAKAMCLLILFLQWNCTVKRDLTVINDKNIQLKLPPPISNSVLEFSAMAWLNKHLLLVPQYPDKFNNTIYTLDAEDISKAIKSGEELKNPGTLKLINLDQAIKRIGKTYEGFEAITVVGNHLYFSIETDSSNANCYLTEGISNGSTVILNPSKMLPVMKRKRLKNAGYESLAWLQGRKKLIAFFEYNKADIGPKALLIDTSLLIQPEPIDFEPLMFRITDVAATGPNRMLALNFHYNGSKTEFKEYIGEDSTKLIPELRGKTFRQSSYSRILQLDLKANSVTWKLKKEISFANENWEGIVPFRNGALIITDEHPGSILKWIKL